MIAQTEPRVESPHLSQFAEVMSAGMSPGKCPADLRPFDKLRAGQAQPATSSVESGGMSLSNAAPRIALKEDDVKNGLGKLVLTIIELLRELLERQAIRRMEGGSLTDAEVERLGSTFMRLYEEMQRLKKEFGLEDDDLNLDLGPLGRLL